MTTNLSQGKRPQQNEDSLFNSMIGFVVLIGTIIVYSILML